MRTLGEAEVREFHEQGYLIVRSALDREDLGPVIAELEDVIDRWSATLHAEGRLRYTFAGLGFEERLARITERSPVVFRGLFNGVHLGPKLFDFLRHPKILALVEGLCGPEIVCHPAFRLRPKVPDMRRTAPLTIVPWHQDAAYMDPRCDGDLYVTVWVALVDASVENGCCEILPRGHVGGILPHVGRENEPLLSIPPESLPSTPPLALPMRAGDLFMMQSLLPHRSLPNRTRGVRWSIDTRYHARALSSGYPQDVGFLVQSPSTPDQVTTAWEALAAARKAHKRVLGHQFRRWPTLPALPPEAGAASEG